MQDGSYTPDVAVVIQSHNKLSHSVTPPLAAPGDLALAKPAPTTSGSVDRATRKCGVQFHDMDSGALSSADGKDGGTNSIVDSAGPGDPSPRKKSAKDVGGVVCAFMHLWSLHHHHQTHQTSHMTCC